VAVIIGSMDGTRWWVPPYSLSDLLRDAPRDQEFPQQFEQALNSALDEAEVLLNAYSGTQSLDRAELTLDQLRVLLHILTVLPPFKTVVQSDQTVGRLERLLDKARPALIVAMTREIDRWAVAGQRSPATVQHAPVAVRKPSQQQLVLIVVIWLAAIWLPVLAIGLPPKDHALFTDWVGTVALATTLASIIMNKNNHN
jgi:hypothetical protein